MSRFAAFTEGWSFRTNTPSFEPGAEITAFVTGRSNGSYVVRIGDTVLSIEDDERETDDGGRDLTDSRVRLRVERFDTNDHTGRATVLEHLDDSAF
jgi:hypothetical protein